MHYLALLASPVRVLGEAPPGGRPPFGPSPGTLSPFQEKREVLEPTKPASKAPLLLLVAVVGAAAYLAVGSSSGYRSNPAWKPGAFARMVNALMDKGYSEDRARRIAAAAGRSKYGQKEMTRRAQLGKKAKKAKKAKRKP